MAERTPSRSAILELRDERGAMADGYAFLDEKCLVLAGEILRELRRHRELRGRLRDAAEAAASALAAALARHGLDDLAAQPPGDATGASVERRRRSVMGVAIAEDTLAGELRPGLPAVLPSPEARACRAAFAAVIAAATPLASCGSNIERLSEEYRRSIRRARALNDVLIPEVERTIADLETQLEDLEREDAIAMRLGAKA